MRAIDYLKDKVLIKTLKTYNRITLNNNDLENLKLKDLWKISMQKPELNENLEKLKVQFRKRISRYTIKV